MLSGNLADFDVAEVIQLIGRTRKTGKLLLNGSRNYVTIFFKDGRAVFASPTDQRDHIGNILIRRGLVSREDVDKALAVQKTLRRKGQNVRIGSILAAKGAVTRETLQRFIRYQLEETVMAALTEKTGSFEFIPELDLDDDDILVSVDPEWIILESSRQLDEWEIVGKNAPSANAVYAINPHPANLAALKLDIEDWRVLSLVNGVRTVEAVVNRSGVSRLAALRTIARLAENDVIVGNHNGDSPKDPWSIIAETYQRPPRPTKNILARVVARIRGL